MPGGRPSKYNQTIKEHSLHEISLWLAEGGTREGLAIELLKIRPDTLYAWMEKHPEFLDAIKSGENLANHKIQGKLFQRAHGFYKEVDEVIRYRDGYEVIKVNKYFPPDPTSLVWFTKNRMPEDWKDRQILEHDVGKHIDIEALKKNVSKKLKELTNGNGHKGDNK